MDLEELEGQIVEMSIFSSMPPVGKQEPSILFDLNGS